MHYLIVAGGTPDELPTSVPDAAEYSLIIGADGGAHNALLLGLTPNVVVGDLDSLAAPERTRLQEGGCRFVTRPAAKDETDLELALLWSKQQGAQQVTILGAFGGRPDHTLTNLCLLADERVRKLDVRLRSRAWEAWLARPETAISGSAGDTVSLIPLSQRVTGVVTDGLQYPLHFETLRRGPGRGVSNVMLGSAAQVSFHSGLLIVMHGPAQGVH